MDKTAFRAAYRKARTIRPTVSSSFPSVYLMGERGAFYFSRSVAGGFLRPAARIATLLSQAAASRSCPADHRTYLTKARAIRAA